MRTVMLGVHHDVGAHPVISGVHPGIGSGRVRTGTVVFYPCSHMNPKSVFVGTGPEPLLRIPGIHPGDVMMFIMMSS